MTGALRQDMNYLNDRLKVDKSFDLIYRTIEIGGREACMYFIDGFCKDELMEKILQYFLSIKAETMPEDAHKMCKLCMPYVEVDLSGKWDNILNNLLSGVFVLLIDGYDKAILIDSREYPSRNVAEPDKDKVLRGSKDGFVETIVFNTALLRRRIRSTDLRVEMYAAGKIPGGFMIVSF